MNNSEKLTAKVTGLGDSLTAKTLEAWQFARIREALAYTAKNSTFYSKHLSGINPEEIKDASDFSRVPFTTAEDVRSSPSDFLCVPPKNVARIASLQTSGTTASAKRIFFTEEDLARTMRLFAWGMIPIAAGGRVLVMMSSGTTDSIASMMHRALSEIGIESAIHGHVTDAALAARDIAKYDCLIGVPSEIIYICRTYPDLRPKSMLLSADYISPSVVAAIRETWHSRVFTHYGMTETCYGCAVQTDENSLHRIRHEDLYAEIIDPHTGRRLPEGERGEIVVTTFAHQAMPLIRYRTGDISSLRRDADFPDGPLGLAGIEGRIGNIIETAGGPVSVERLDDLIYKHCGVRAYRAVLKTDGTLRIEADCMADTALSAIREEIRRELNGMNIETKMTELPPSMGIKKRNIILEEENVCTAK